MVGLLALSLSLFGCQRLPGDKGGATSGAASPGSPQTSPPGSQTSGKAPQVVFFPSSGGAPVPVRVELARTQEEQMRGLMFRRSLDVDAGMLFLFDRPDIRRFWMRNCYIPLDMIFLDDHKVVVGIEENTIPGDETGRGPDQPAQYVVEVQGGYARAHGIGLGSRAEFRNVN
jgi:hypothetical protein